MCFIAFGYRCRADFPLIIAAGRDELYDRPADGPGLLASSPAVLGGRDRRAGGTWLGVNAHGVLAAITNRSGEAADPARPSRGWIALEALKHPTADAVRHWLETKIPAQNPFNLLYADAAAAYVSYVARDREPLTEEVPPGMHLLTNEHPLDALDLPALRRIDLDRPISELIQGLCALLSTDSADGRQGYVVAKDRGRYGTVSASVLALSSDFPSGSLYYHAQGNPASTPFADLSALLQKLELPASHPAR